jgi:transcription initiation factor TFIIIB Brf1 subunit/transcription initiation factor TFIIB
MGFAATILYLSCLKTGENKTQTDIAQAAGVTEVTLRNRFKDLKQIDIAKIARTFNVGGSETTCL